MAETRPEVLWFGTPPAAETEREFRHRNLSLRCCATTAPVEPANACAAVFRFGADLPDDVLRAANAHARMLVDSGLRIDLVADDDETMGRVQAGSKSVLKLPGVAARTDPPPHSLAEKIARHDAGQRPHPGLQIEVAGKREPLRDVDEILFQRAFAHCSRIVLEELTGGLSQARVFAVHMTVHTSNAGIWPQPDFAKLDRRDKIEKEHSNYLNFAKRFIPFGLSPNIHDQIVGAERSLLVGNFVDRSESLWNLARRNLSARAVTSLIEETLGGWRDQAYAQDPVEGSVAEAMLEAGLLKPDKINSRHVEAVSRLGITTEPGVILGQLRGLTQRYRTAPAHGDLHGENVRVRNDRAIIIDLASVVPSAPLTVDLAALETWFAFQLPPECDPLKYEDAVWAAEIDRRSRSVSASTRTLRPDEQVLLDVHRGSATQTHGNRDTILLHRVPSRGGRPALEAVSMGRRPCGRPLQADERLRRRGPIGARTVR
ncbi:MULTISPECIES: hypothetical protein [unclassified Bradyrhizobium]|uniref:hypothetical protein n=1 Tax=unclassified Bradyrhizobium TaxID=2631580 RepID=UPI001FFB0E33|nr:MULTISPECIES: hypothetical protein [unclassified Bradyrhizobium]MCK1707895.1 hypothetical protein [Bradyrhizobium sp. 143]MCK1728604.1 hypothetical protein [Bradyrhizobium sp. 142]